MAARVSSVTSLLCLFVCKVGSISNVAVASSHPWGTVLTEGWISCHHLLLKAVHFHHHHPGFLGSASSWSSVLLQSLLLHLSDCVCNPFASPFITICLLLFTIPAPLSSSLPPFLHSTRTRLPGGDILSHFHSSWTFVFRQHHFSHSFSCALSIISLFMDLKGS